MSNASLIFHHSSPAEYGREIADAHMLNGRPLVTSYTAESVALDAVAEVLEDGGSAMFANAVYDAVHARWTEWFGGTEESVQLAARRFATLQTSESMQDYARAAYSYRQQR